MEFILMLNRLGLTVMISAAIVQFILSGNKSAIAQEREGCFLVNSAGQVVNLNELCLPQEPAVNITGNDGKFIEDYKRLAKSYSPEATDNLLQVIQRSPGQKIAAAKKNVCRGKIRIIFTGVKTKSDRAS
jgi:hypothetical protein